MATISGTITAATRHGLDDDVPNTLSGGSSDDVINGFGGGDQLFGGGGHDVINGGFGDDFISGGTGWDTLTGGVGADTFFFAKHDSGPNFWQADVITDFNAADGDRIDLQGVTPASGKYMETAVFNDGNHVDNYNLALSFAKEHISANGIQVVFATDHHDGYLFADLDHNGLVDTGIELPGLTDIHDFSWRNLL